jgi:RNA polymerase sigma-70 factor, ECF subfamily
LTLRTWAPTLAHVENGTSVGSAAVGGDAAAIAQTGAGPAWQPPRSRVDLSAEEAALACVHRDRRGEALKILMRVYGAPITAFALRVVRNRELAYDIRQQVFLEAFQGIDRFEGRSSLWSWLCGIAYHRCLDELRRARRASTNDDLALADVLVARGESIVDAERIAKRRALEQCLGKLTVELRTQLLMRCFFGLSYAEIGETIGAAHSTVQVRISRILPRLRRCLRDEGLTR